MSNPSKRTRARIIRSALILFSTFGKNGTHMAQIALHAGVNKASICYHFRSKDNLYRIVFQSSLKHVVKNIYNRLLNSRLLLKDDSVKDILNRLWDGHPLIMKLFIHELISGALELRYVLTTGNKQTREALRQLAAIFPMLEMNPIQNPAEDDEFYFRKATQVVAQSMSHRLVDTVIETIFKKPIK